WTRWQLGKLYWSVGRIDAAEHQYRAALATFPNYVYALDALAQVEAARGRTGQAISLERRAIDEVPLPQFAALLGDLYRAHGQLAAAHRYLGSALALNPQFSVVWSPVARKALG